MAYARFFMPFANETKGYEFKGRTPAGRCILESRMGNGKLSVLAQDLKPEVKYGVYLIFAEERRHVGLAMGGLAVAENGKGEFRRDVSQENLHNFALSDVIAVAVLDENATNTASPLCGYKNEPVQWQYGFRVWEKPAPVPVTPKPVAEPVKTEPEIVEPEVIEPAVVEPELPEIEEEPMPVEPPTEEAEEIENEVEEEEEEEEEEPTPAPFPPLPSTPPRATRPPGAQNPPEKIQPPLATVPQEE